MSQPATKEDKLSEVHAWIEKAKETIIRQEKRIEDLEAENLELHKKLIKQEGNLV